ncbi:MAG: hypothetical protein EOO23_08070 [Comamonadaceae bacterium]|nr:MAG: hypothetical protein EOO23_08070 [Comamonadaceae bacterium]
METLCGGTSLSGFISVGCIVYDFQTLLIGLVAVIVAIIAGIPVWRQLRDSNLQTRISHRETLAALLRDALTRFRKADESISAPLSTAYRLTHDPSGEPQEIDTENAFGLEQIVAGKLDWYLVLLAGTEHENIEARKAELQVALETLDETLSNAHWADHNDQDDEYRSIPDAEWAQIVARCAEAKIEASRRVSEATAAYRSLKGAQDAWAQTLRTRIAKLDLQIAAAE